MARKEREEEIEEDEEEEEADTRKQPKLKKADKNQPEVMEVEISLQLLNQKLNFIIARLDEIISLAHNTIRSSVDVTAHAEMNAIREACRDLGTTVLSGCEIYATFKPCSMCMEAIKRAGIIKVYYGAGPEDVDYPVIETSFEVTGGVLQEECLILGSKKY